MGKYLDMLKRLDVKADDGEKSELCEQRFANPSSNEVSHNRSGDLIRLSRFFRPLDELERRCPEYVELGRWHQAVEDGRRSSPVGGNRPTRWVGPRATCLDCTNRPPFRTRLTSA
jgi:hypothetical protein